MMALLRTRRWISFTLLVIIVIVAFGFLSRWQWSRAEERREQHNAIATEAAPIPYSPAGNTEWQPVTVTGTYATEQLLIRRRPLNGSNGFWVVTPLRIEDGNVVSVVRGWISATAAPTDVVIPPAPPAGTVSIAGRWRVAEAAESTDGLPRGQAMSVASGYIQLTSSDPAQSELTLLPLPEVDESRNVSYAIQWLLFAAVAIFGWYFFLRREAKDSDGS